MREPLDDGNRGTQASLREFSRRHHPKKRRKFNYELLTAIQIADRVERLRTESRSTLDRQFLGGPDLNTSHASTGDPGDFYAFVVMGRRQG